MLNRRVIASLFAAALMATPALAREPTPQQTTAPAIPLLSTATTVVGQPIVYPTGKPEITSEIVTIEPGGRTILHEHGVPMYFYILQGKLIVNYGPKGEHAYNQGDAGMEAMDLAHYGRNAGTDPVRILVVYMGAAGSADVIPLK